MGLGFIPLIRAWLVMKHREKYSHIEVGMALNYFLGLPIVYYDIVILGNLESFVFLFSNNFFSIVFRYMFLTCGTFLLYKGLSSIYKSFTPKARVGGVET